mmetsp:Transcript_727/g.2059  ORF Transcript_727/g.2059 Transcript_727/m.2059 type:complete len:547 (-) Transcript_727:269-1909(-)
MPWGPRIFLRAWRTCTVHGPCRRRGWPVGTTCLHMRTPTRRHRRTWPCMGIRRCSTATLAVLATLVTLAMPATPATLMGSRLPCTVIMGSRTPWRKCKRRRKRQHQTLDPPALAWGSRTVVRLRLGRRQRQGRMACRLTRRRRRRRRTLLQRTLCPPAWARPRTRSAWSPLPHPSCPLSCANVRMARARVGPRSLSSSRPSRPLSEQQDCSQPRSRRRTPRTRLSSGDGRVPRALALAWSVPTAGLLRLPHPPLRPLPLTMRRRTCLPPLVAHWTWPSCLAPSWTAPAPPLPPRRPPFRQRWPRLSLPTLEPRSRADGARLAARPALSQALRSAASSRARLWAPRRAGRRSPRPVTAPRWRRRWTSRCPARRCCSSGRRTTCRSARSARSSRVCWRTKGARMGPRHQGRRVETQDRRRTCQGRMPPRRWGWATWAAGAAPRPPAPPSAATTAALTRRPRTHPASRWAPPPSPSAPARRRACCAGSWPCCSASWAAHRRAACWAPTWARRWPRTTASATACSSRASRGSCLFWRATRRRSAWRTTRR